MAAERKELKLADIHSDLHEDFHCKMFATWPSLTSLWNRLQGCESGQEQNSTTKQASGSKKEEYFTQTPSLIGVEPWLDCGSRNQLICCLKIFLSPLSRVLIINCLNLKRLLHLNSNVIFPIYCKPVQYFCTFTVQNSSWISFILPIKSRSILNFFLIYFFSLFYNDIPLEIIKVNINFPTRSYVSIFDIFS